MRFIGKDTCKIAKQTEKIKHQKHDCRGGAQNKKHKSIGFLYIVLV